MPAHLQPKPQQHPRWTIIFDDEVAFNNFLAGFANENDDDIWISREVISSFHTFGTPNQRVGRFLNLKKGLFELRLRRDPNVLVRLFFYIESQNVINFVWFYDKKKNSNATYQNKQIKIARKKH